MFFYVSFPERKDCLPPIINFGLTDNKWPETGKYIKDLITFFQFTAQEHCNKVVSSSVHGCSASSFDTKSGLFLNYFHMVVNSTTGRFLFPKMLFRKDKHKLVYLTCFSRIVVNRTTVGESYEHGFILLAKGGVKASISGKRTVIKGPRYAFFNARKSHSTLEEFNAYHGLNISWKCESNGTDIPVLDNSSEEDRLLDRATSFVDVKVDTSLLHEGVNATLTLKVEKHKNTDVVKKTLVVYNAPFFSLR